MPRRTQKDWVQTNLRLPPELYRALKQAVESGPVDTSMNAFVVQVVRAELERRGVRP